jgi:hypothetical protein
METNQNNTKAIVSLILGILSLIFIFVPSVGWVGIILGIVGLVFGILANKEQHSGMATAGIVLSAIAVGLCVITFIACVACVSSLGGLLGTAATYNF